MTGPDQRTVAARIPGAAALGLVPQPSAPVVPGTVLADAGWTAEVLGRRARTQGTADRRVVATVWWYSLSSVLLTPPLAGLVTGVPLSARLADTSVSLLPGPLPIAAVAGPGSGGLAGELREALGAVVAAVAEAGGVRERPLWAVATDSLANRLLALGRAVGDVPGATALAGSLAAAMGPELLVPRYEDVSGVRFTRRASCCLMVEVPGGSLCTSCPRRPPAERLRLLEETARRL